MRCDVMRRDGCEDAHTYSLVNTMSIPVGDHPGWYADPDFVIHSVQRTTIASYRRILKKILASLSYLSLLLSHPCLPFASCLFLIIDAVDHDSRQRCSDMAKQRQCEKQKKHPRTLHISCARACVDLR